MQVLLTYIYILTYTDCITYTTSRKDRKHWIELTLHGEMYAEHQVCLAVSRL